MTRQIIIYLFKILILCLMVYPLWIDLILIRTATPALIFRVQPFVPSAAFVLIFAGAISIGAKSKTVVLWTVFCLAYTAVFLVFWPYATTVIALCVLAGAINFLYRNRITEPFLVLLPLIAGAWLFLNSVYMVSFLAWAYYVTGKEDLGRSLIQGLIAMKDRSNTILFVLPILVMYFLGKQVYLKVSIVVSFVRSNWRFERDRTQSGSP